MSKTTYHFFSCFNAHKQEICHFFTCARGRAARRCKPRLASPPSPIAGVPSAATSATCPGRATECKSMYIGACGTYWVLTKCTYTYKLVIEYAFKLPPPRNWNISIQCSQPSRKEDERKMPTQIVRLRSKCQLFATCYEHQWKTCASAQQAANTEGKDVRLQNATTTWGIPLLLLENQRQLREHVFWEKQVYKTKEHMLFHPTNNGT